MLVGCWLYSLAKDNYDKADKREEIEICAKLDQKKF